MLKSLYTNTSSVKAVAGLLVVTLGTSYIQQNSTEIVNSLSRVAKIAGEKVNVALHNGKQHLYEVNIANGRMSDTGKSTWR